MNYSISVNMNSFNLIFSIFVITTVMINVNSQDTVCSAANIPNLIDGFKNMNFQTKPICEKLMMLVSKFSTENQEKLLEAYDENNVEYCFGSGVILDTIDSQTVLDAQAISTDSTEQMQESRKPATGCCSAGEAVTGTVIEAVDPNQTCVDLVKDLGAPLMNLAKGYKKNCLICREMAKGCIVQSIAVLQSAYLGKNGCIKFCSPTEEQVVKIKEAYTQLLTPLDNIDKSIIQSSNDCVNKIGLMTQCTNTPSLLSEVSTSK